MKSKVPFIVPDFPAPSDVARDFQAIVESNWFTNFGPFEREFCSNLSGYIGQGVRVATVANATLGLMLAMKALFNSPTDDRKDVLMPAFTFAAGAEALIWCGYTPVFIDIDRESLQPDIKMTHRYIHNNSKSLVGILMCNTFGVGADNLDAWEQLGKEFELPVIIDSAAGLGSTYSDNAKLGCRGDCEVFSLHATKPFAVGEGGVVASRSKGLIDKIKRLENFGFDDQHVAQDLGLNAKLQEINCAIGLRQLKRIDEMIDVRRMNLSLYKKELANSGFGFQSNDDGSTVPFVTVLAPSGKVADAYLQDLSNNGIEARRYYSPPLHKQPVIAKQSKQAETRLRVTDDVCRRIISLPSHRKLDAKTIQLICSFAPKMKTNEDKF